MQLDVHVHRDLHACRAALCSHPKRLHWTRVSLGLQVLVLIALLSEHCRTTVSSPSRAARRDGLAFHAASGSSVFGALAPQHGSLDASDTRAAQVLLSTVYAHNAVELCGPAILTLLPSWESATLTLLTIPCIGVLAKVGAWVTTIPNW